MPFFSYVCYETVHATCIGTSSHISICACVCFYFLFFFRAYACLYLHHTNYIIQTQKCILYIYIGIWVQNKYILTYAMNSHKMKSTMIKSSSLQKNDRTKRLRRSGSPFSLIGPNRPPSLVIRNPVLILCTWISHIICICSWSGSVIAQALLDGVVMIQFAISYADKYHHVTSNDSCVSVVTYFQRYASNQRRCTGLIQILRWPSCLYHQNFKKKSQMNFNEKDWENSCKHKQQENTFFHI